MQVYLDTNAWDALLDAHVSRRRLEGIEILFSSCILDEIGLASVHRARDLARFAWSVSNKKKLLDHLELTSKEIEAYREGKQLSRIYDIGDSMFFHGWVKLRSRETPEALRAQMQARMRDAKVQFRDWLKGVRSRFPPQSARTAQHDLADAWRELLAELEEEGYISQMLVEVLRSEGLQADSTDEVPYRALPATACWVQYYLALAFLAAYGSGKFARPHRGDQADFRHACYAGLSDLFVSGDARMLYVLREMVPVRRASIVSPEEFIEMIDNRQ